MKNIPKFIVFLFLTFLMFEISIEAVKASRDQLRLINARSLSKSIQFYYNINKNYPESGLGKNVAEKLYNEELLTKSLRDPAYISATVPINYYYYKASNTYNKIYATIKDFNSKDYFTQLKSKFNNYLGNDNKNNIESFSKLNNQRKQNMNNWVDSSNVSNNTTIEEKNNGVLVTNILPQKNILDNNGIPLECVIAYKADNETNSYEISVFLESRFFKDKMKWDGGYDNNRYEIGNDLRLNTELVISDMGIKSISENVSIIK